MAIYALGSLRPQVDPSAWVADTATVVGDVVLGQDASVWFGSVLRGDSDRIVIGAQSNIQDQSVLHVDAGVPLTVGRGVTVGHRVTLHGCTVGDGALIGMGAIILNHARIGARCLVGAGALVTEGKEFPEGSLILGSPARVARRLTTGELERLQAAAHHYVENAHRFRRELNLTLSHKAVVDV